MSGDSLGTGIAEDPDSVPVSSENFELWIRMATDNKINTNNTWNFALIDYFHDFTVLREGDGVNFQKASTTLDGCMKIYSHRIDSAAKDTGTLLSSLNIKSKQNTISSRPSSSNNHAPPASGAGNLNKNNQAGSHNDDDGENQNEDDSDDELSDDAPDDGTIITGGNSKSKSKSKNKKKHTYLAPSFNTIKIKDQDRPVKPDPVFKNALANFDEGGAKSLLNNILRLSRESKVVFDIADDTELIIEDDSEEDEDGKESAQDEAYGGSDPTRGDCEDSIDINLLKRLVDFDIINHSLDVCPSLKELDEISNGKTDPANLLEYMDEVDVSRIENDRRLNIEGHINDTFDDNAQPDFMHDPDINMAESSDNNSNESDKMSNVSKRTQYSLYIDGVEDPDESGHNITFTNLFDENRQREQGKIREKDLIDATKPDKTDIDMIKIYDSIGTRPRLYWKIARLKRSTSNNRTFNEIDNDEEDTHNNRSSKYSQKSTSRAYNKKKDVVLIDFLSDKNDPNEEELFASTEYLSKIMLTEKERKSGRHLLDSDAPFTAKRLAFLSTKPNQLIKSVLMQKRKNTFEERELDNIPASEEFFAQAYRDENDNDILNDSIFSDPIDHPSSFNDNDDFDPNGIEGFEVPLPNPFEEQPRNTENMNAHPQTLYRTNAISYAKRSKKVDVKLLKQNIWNSIEEISIHKKKRFASHFEEEVGNGGGYSNKVQEEGTPLEVESSATRSEESTTRTSTMSPPAMDDFVDSGEDIDSMQFTNVVEKMSLKYNTKTKRDLSTSFCFICLLHLANEQGLTLETLSNNEDIIIHK